MVRVFGPRHERKTCSRGGQSALWSRIPSLLQNCLTLTLTHDQNTRSSHANTVATHLNMYRRFLFLHQPRRDHNNRSNAGGEKHTPRREELVSLYESEETKIWGQTPQTGRYEAAAELGSVLRLEFRAAFLLVLHYKCIITQRERSVLGLDVQLDLPSQSAVRSSLVVGAC